MGNLKKVSPLVRKSMDNYPYLFNNGAILEITGAPQESGNNYNGFYEMNPETDNGEPPFIFSRAGVIVALHKGGSPWQLIITPDHGTLMVAYSSHGTEKNTFESGTWMNFSSVKFQTSCTGEWSTMRIRVFWRQTPRSPTA